MEVIFAFMLEMVSQKTQFLDKFITFWTVDKMLKILTFVGPKYEMNSMNEIDLFFLSKFICAI